MRDVFAVIEKGSGEMAAATIRSIFAKTTADALRTQLNVVADMLGGQLVPAQRDQFVVVRPSSPPQIPAHTCEKCSRAAAPLALSCVAAR